MVYMVSSLGNDVRFQIVKMITAIDIQFVLKSERFLEPFWYIASVFLSQSVIQPNQTKPNQTMPSGMFQPSYE